MNITALLAGLFSGILGSMGLGGGGVLIIYLSLFTETEQLKAQGINLLFFIPIGVVSVIIYSFKKLIKWKIILKIILFGMIGTFIGWGAASLLGAKYTAKVFGTLLAVMGLKELFSKKDVAERNKKCYTENE